MPGGQLFSCLKYGVSLAGLLVLTGCLTDNEDNRSSGVPLSRAMQASASGSREHLHGSNANETHIYDGSDDNANDSTSTSAGGSSSGFSLVSYQQRDYDYQALADTAFSVPFNGEIQSITRFTLTPIATEDDYNYLGLFLGGDLVDLQPGSLPDRAIDSTWMFEAGLDYRRYLTPAHVFMSPYISVGLAYQLLNWSYRNPVFINGDKIQSDSLEGAGGYAGFGVAFKRNSHLSFFGEADLGGTVFLSQTTQGFDNDVFNNFGYFMVRAGLCLKF